MSDTVDQLAATIEEIFQQMGWVWGLELAGIPEHVPDQQEIARKITEIESRPLRSVRLASHGRIVLVVKDPEYPDHIRVLLDIGEIPLDNQGETA